MANSILRAFHALEAHGGAIWYYIRPYTHILFRGPNTPSTDSLIIRLSPYIHWDDRYHSKGDVIRWAAAASAVPYTEEVGRDVVSALLQIACCNSLRPHVPLNIWTWLKKHSTLPPVYREQCMNITGNVVRYIRGLGDIEILKSFLLHSWSGGNFIVHAEHYMKDLLREDFCGIGMWGHRKDLVKLLGRILAPRGLGWATEPSTQGSRGSGANLVHLTREGEVSSIGSAGTTQTSTQGSLCVYGELRDILLEVEREAAKILIRMLPNFSFFHEYADSRKWDTHRIALHLHLCSTPPLPMTSPRILSMFGSNALFSFCHPIPSGLSTSPLSRNCCAIVFGSSEGNDHTFRDSSGDKPSFSL